MKLLSDGDGDEGVFRGQKSILRIFPHKDDGIIIMRKTGSVETKMEPLLGGTLHLQSFQHKK